MEAAHGGVVRPEVLPSDQFYDASSDLWLWDVGVPASFASETATRLAIRRDELDRAHYLAAALAEGPHATALPRDPVDRLAYRTGLTTTRARWLAEAWADLDPRVSENHQVLVHYLSDVPTLPSRAALDRLTDSIAPGAVDVRVTLVLAITHNVPTAGALWRSGVREPLVAAARLARS